MTADCLFCKIAAGNAPARVVYADDAVTAFHDIRPQASTHLLVIPNKHLDSLDAAEEADAELLARLLQVAVRVAREAGIADSGYRVVTNTGAHGCQSVPHLHFHVLGGNQLQPRLG
ncbi:MAG TPA: histidine triad nucleotide-binding protein [Thermomicrobiaceae bacterium]|nr:histidine triad nucleotide-binding protein [Thermomicrobiaceae bacterium]